MQKYFGEVAYFQEGNEEDKNKAREYLEFWKKNLLFKLKKDSYELELVDEQWGERPAYLCSLLSQYGALYLKICVKAKFNFELT